MCDGDDVAEPAEELDPGDLEAPAGAGHRGQQDEGDPDRRQEGEHLPGFDLLGPEEQHDQGGQRHGEDVHRAGDVAEDAVPEAEPGGLLQWPVSEVRVADEGEGAEAPAVLLADEGGQAGGRHALGDQRGHVAGGPAGAGEGEAGVEVLAVVDLGEAADPGQCGAAVEGVGAAADGAVLGVPGGLDPAVEDLLGGSGGPFEPGHVGVGVEALRALDDADLGVVEVGHQVVQEVGAGAEVGVEDGDDLAGAFGQAVVEVAGLLEAAAVGAGAVLEAVGLGESAHLGAVGVVEDEDGEFAGPADGGGVAVGVVEDGQRFAGGGQQEVHAGVAGGLPGAHQQVVRVAGVAAGALAVGEREQPGGGVEHGEQEERPEQRLAEGEQAEGGGGSRVGEGGAEQHPAALRAEVPVELLVVGRAGQSEVGVRGCRARTGVGCGHGGAMAYGHAEMAPWAADGTWPFAPSLSHWPRPIMNEV